MTRSSIAPDGAVAIALAVLATVLLGLVFAASAHVDRREALPPYAIRATPELLDALNTGDSQPIPLIRVAFRRPDSDTLANMLLGFLVWLPCTASVLAAVLQFHLLCQMQAGSKVRRGTAILMLALFIAAVAWAVEDNAIFDLLMVMLILTVLLAIAVWRAAVPRKGVLIAVLAFMVAGIAASITSHRLYTVYHGLVPVLFSDENAEQRVLSELQRDIRATVHVTAEDVFDRIERLPSLNAWGSGPALFSKNRVGTKAVVVFGLVYLLVFACALLRIKSAHDMGPGFLVAYALVLYVTMGASFGLVYFNDVLSAAGRQNVLCILAEGASVPPEQFDRLKEQFVHFGWNQKLEQAIEEVRNTATPQAEEVLRAALAEHWSNSVIAQEQPQSANDGAGRLRPEARLVTNQTLADMFYFSFASFTTTGYGDLRPVSDSARFWSIVENIAELLFTAIFFVVALAEGSVSGERRQLIEGAPQHGPPASAVKVLLLTCMAMLCLAHCTTTAEKPIGSHAFPGPPDAFCPVLARPEEVHVRVIIDDSRSMLGYFGTADSTYAQHLRSLLVTLTAKAHPTFHRLSEPARATRLEETYSRDFYGRRDTPLSRVFQFADSDEPNTSVVVISDLEQYENGGFQLLSDAIRHAMAKRPFVSLYGWKAGYVNRRGVAGSRGWYALLMANSASRLSQVEQASGVQAESYPGSFSGIGAEHVEGPNYFRSRTFTRVESLQWVDEEVPDLQWQPAVAVRPLYKCKGSEQAVQYSAFVQLEPQSGPIRFRGMLITEIPLADVGDVKVTILRLISDGHGVVTRHSVVPSETTHVEVHRRSPANVRRTVSGQTRPAGAVGGDPDPAAPKASSLSRLQVIPLEVVYSLPLEGGKTSYLVEFRTGRLNLGCPDWVKKWSTTDEHEWQKTLNLEGIVQTMIEASSKDEVFLIHYLIVSKATAL